MISSKTATERRTPADMSHPARYDFGFLMGGVVATAPEGFSHEFEEMKAYVGFTPEDAGLLHAFHADVGHALPVVVDAFYERLMHFAEARRVFRDEAQIERQKRTLLQWLHELLNGPHDLAYYARRERIGRVHVEVDLPSRYMFTAMAVVRESLCGLAHKRYPTGHAERLCVAIQRITELDLAIMTGTYIDSREARERRRLQELIVSHLPVTVLLADAEGRVTAATRPDQWPFVRSEWLGAPITAVLPSTLVEASDLGSLLPLVLSGREPMCVPRVTAAVDGAERTFRLTLVPLDDTIARLLLHVEDLTEIVSTENRLRESETLAQLGALSAAVAHELRNPLAGISGAIQVIGRSMGDDDRRRPVLRKVDEQISRLNTLVTDLLSFARPGSARARDLGLAEVSTQVAELAFSDQPTIRWRVSGDGRGAADTNLLHQILLNLLQNAAQAIDGSGQVEIQVADREIRVTDSGPGIPAEIRERVFEPFFTTRTRGTGLGLSICRKAARAMDAELALEPAPAGGPTGASFVLRFERSRRA